MITFGSQNIIYLLVSRRRKRGGEGEGERVDEKWAEDEERNMDVDHYKNKVKMK